MNYIFRKRDVKQTEPTKPQYSLINKTDGELLTKLYQSCHNGSIDVMKLIIENRHVDVNEISDQQKLSQGLTLVHIAARHNQPECLAYLISAGADINAPDFFGFRPIHDASLHGHIHCLKILLDNGSLVDSPENLKHITPMYYALQQGHVGCARLLQNHEVINDAVLWDIVSKRGNVEILDFLREKNLPRSQIAGVLRRSSLCGHVSVLQKLQNKIKVNEFSSDESLQSIVTAVQHGRVDYLKELLEQGINPNMCTKDKATPLHYAARYGYKDCYSLLVRNGADMDRRTSNNLTPLHIAIRQCCKEGVEASIDNGCDVNAVGGDLNDSPVHIALKSSVDTQTMKALLNGRPNLAIKNKEGKLPLDVICENPQLNEMVLEYARN